MNLEWIKSIDDIFALRNGQPFHDKFYTGKRMARKYADEQGTRQKDNALRRRYRDTYVQVHAQRGREMRERLALDGEYLIEDVLRDGHGILLVQLQVSDYSRCGISLPFRHVFVHFSLLDLPENNLEVR